MSRKQSLKKRLLSSHLVVASIGLALLLVMTGMIFYLRSNTEEMANYRVPKLVAYSNTIFAINESMNMLDAWEDSKNPQFKEKRAAIWQEKIWPGFYSILKHIDESEKKTKLRLKQQFRDIEEWQRDIEDTVHMPGNNSIYVYWRHHVKGRAQFIIDRITDFINIESDLRLGGRRKMIFRHAADFRAHFSQAQTLLLDYVEKQSRSSEELFDDKRQIIESVFSELLSEKKYFKPEQSNAINYLIEKLKSYDVHIKELKGLSSSENQNYARSLIVGKLQPVMLEIKDYFERNIQEEEEALAATKKELQRIGEYTWILIVVCIVVLVVVAVSFTNAITNRIMNPVLALANSANAINEGDLSQSIDIDADIELEDLAQSFDSMRLSLKETQEVQNKANEALKVQNEYRSRMSSLVDELQGFLELDEVAERTLNFLNKEMNNTIGVFYLRGDTDSYELSRCHGVDARKLEYDSFPIGTGVLGKIAQDRKYKILKNSECELKAETSLLEINSKEFLIIPLVYNDVTEGLLELGFDRVLTDLEKEFMQDAAEQIALAVVSNSSRIRTEQLLDVSQQQAAELESQQNEILKSNAELQEKSEELRVQSDQLEASNVELEEKSEELRAQSDQLKHSNQELEEKS